MLDGMLDGDLEFEAQGRLRSGDDHSPAHAPNRRSGQTGVVKRSTALRHLVELAEAASERLRFRSTELGWPLEELWVAGALLDSIDELDHGSVVLMLDLPPDELPWLAAHPAAEWIGDQLRLGKRPLWWSYRPTAWPPWTYRDRRVARFWSATTGLDEELIEALRTQRPVTIVEPTQAQLVEQLGIELPAAKAHLRSILGHYWDHEWRRTNRHDTSPEDQLWRAATAVTEIEAAIDEQSS